MFSGSPLARWELWLAVAALLWVLAQLLSSYDGRKNNFST